LAAVSVFDASFGESFALFVLPALEATLLLGVKLETALAGFAVFAAVFFALNVYPSLNVHIMVFLLLCSG
jgi:hypothetical protein